MASCRAIPSTRRGLTLVELLAVIAIIGTLVGLLLPAVQTARESARRTTCANNIKQLAVALLTHESSKRVLPYGRGGPVWSNVTSGVPNTDSKPAYGDTVDGVAYPGAGALSTYVPLLPFIEEQALSDTINSTQTRMGDVSTTSAYAKKLPQILCPSDIPTPEINASRGQSNYVFSYGDKCDGLADDATVALTAVISDPTHALKPAGQRGLFGLNSSTKMSQIADGLSSTIAISECTRPEGSGNTATNGPTANTNYSTNGPSGCKANFSGGWTLAAAAAAIINRDRSMGTAWANGRFGFNGFNTILQPNYGACNAYTFTGTQPPRSRHGGGVMAAFADGSVVFISENIDAGSAAASQPNSPTAASPYGVWGALGTMNSGESARQP